MHEEFPPGNLNETDCALYLYEHQSSYCPNMPLRGLLYFTDIYRKIFSGVDLSVKKTLKIPTPYYIVFYNRLTKTEEEFTQNLSDSFENAGKGCMELTVQYININFGKNKELLERCKPLYDYAYFVAEVRKNIGNLPIKDSIENAIEQCISNNILKEFLSEQKAEVVSMLLYEYNEEYVRKSLEETGYENGYIKGANQLGHLIKILLSEGKTQDALAVSENETLREEYYKKYHISE